MESLALGGNPPRCSLLGLQTKPAKTHVNTSSSGESLPLKNSAPVIEPKLRCMGTPPCLSATFSKGNNFCDFQFAFLDHAALEKLGLLIKKKNLLPGSKFVDPRWRGR